MYNIRQCNGRLRCIPRNGSFPYAFADWLTPAGSRPSFVVLRCHLASFRYSVFSVFLCFCFFFCRNFLGLMSADEVKYHLTMGMVRPPPPPPSIVLLLGPDQSPHAAVSATQYTASSSCRKRYSMVAIFALGW